MSQYNCLFKKLQSTLPQLFQKIINVLFPIFWKAKHKLPYEIIWISYLTINKQNQLKTQKFKEMSIIIQKYIYLMFTTCPALLQIPRIQQLTKQPKTPAFMELAFQCERENKPINKIPCWMAIDAMEKNYALKGEYRYQCIHAESISKKVVTDVLTEMASSE